MPASIRSRTGHWVKHDMITRVNSAAFESGSVNADKIAAGAITQDKFAAGVGSASVGPTIAAVTPANSGFVANGQPNVPTTGGYVIITGTNFQVGTTVMIGTGMATAVTYVSSTELHVQVPGRSAGSYMVQVANDDGRYALKNAGITYA